MVVDDAPVMVHTSGSLMKRIWLGFLSELTDIFISVQLFETAWHEMKKRPKEV